MRRSALAAAAFLLLAVQLRAASEIVVAIRYLQGEGVSHSRLYLYREDGKFLRQLTNDGPGHDVDPIFAPDGESIVFTRENEGRTLEFWSVQPLGAAAARLEAAPEWYEKTKTSPYFTNRDSTSESESPTPSAASSPAGVIGERKTYKAPDGSVELILREDPSDPDDQANGTSRQTLRASLFENWNPGRLRSVTGFLWRLRNFARATKSGPPIFARGLIAHGFFRFAPEQH
jgi:hypothetical protein